MFEGRLDAAVPFTNVLQVGGEGGGVRLQRLRAADQVVEAGPGRQLDGERKAADRAGRCGQSPGVRRNQGWSSGRCAGAGR